MDLSKLNVLMADVVRRCRAEEGIGYHVLGHQELEMKELVRITKNGFGLLTVGNFIDGNCYRVCRVPSLRYSANNLLAECCAENVTLGLLACLPSIFLRYSANSSLSSYFLTLGKQVSFPSIFTST